MPSHDKIIFHMLFGAFQINGQMPSHDKIIFHMLFGAFHITPRISFQPVPSQVTCCTLILYLLYFKRSIHERRSIPETRYI